MTHALIIGCIFDHVGRVVHTLEHIPLARKNGKAVQQLSQSAMDNPGGTLSKKKRSTGKRLTAKERKKQKQQREKEARRRRRDGKKKPDSNDES